MATHSCTLDTCPIEYSILGYRPSLAASITFIALHSLLLVVHFWLGLRWKAWWFSSCMMLGCLSNVVGYVARIVLYNNPFNFITFIIQIVFIGSSPVFYTGAIYVTMTKTVETLDESLSRIKPKLYYVIFLTGDIICLALQAAGGAISSLSTGSDATGVDLALAGLILQVVGVLAFVVLLGDYLARYFKGKPLKSIDRRLRIFFTFLSLAIILILGRCAYRVAELSEGYSGTIFHNEGLFIGLEGVVIVLAVTALCIGHPGLAFDEGFGSVKVASSLPSRDGGGSGMELVNK